VQRRQWRILRYPGKLGSSSPLSGHLAMRGLSSLLNRLSRPYVVSSRFWLLAAADCDERAVLSMLCPGLGLGYRTWTLVSVAWGRLWPSSDFR
jgi:hypothetical protein